MASFDTVIQKYSTFPGYSGNPPTTEAEYNELFSEWAEKPAWTEVQAKVAVNTVQTTRAEAYPSIQEQLDMQYWDSVNGTTTWADAIAQVKADNPKPSE